MHLLFLAAIFQVGCTILAQIEVEYVASLDAWGKAYGAGILSPEFQSNTLYVIQDSGTFLAKKNSSMIDTNLDNVQRSRWWQGWWPLKPSKTTFEFVEVKFSDYSVSEYAGYVPISACQSQEKGQVGAITFQYLLTTGAREFGKIATSINYWIISLELLLQIDLTRIATVSETSICDVKAGTTGQLLSRPIIAQFGMLQRTRIWDLANQKFERASDFIKVVDNTYLVSDANIYCATSDVVNLFCDDMSNFIDWVNPKEISFISKEPEENQQDNIPEEDEKIKDIEDIQDVDDGEAISSNPEVADDDASGDPLEDIPEDNIGEDEDQVEEEEEEQNNPKDPNDPNEPNENELKNKNGREGSEDYIDHVPSSVPIQNTDTTSRPAETFPTPKTFPVSNSSSCINQPLYCNISTLVSLHR